MPPAANPRSANPRSFNPRSFNPRSFNPRSFNHCLVYVTAADEAEAREIGRAMVDARLAACANVLPHMVPIFRWEGAVDEGSESVVILKTTDVRVDALIEAVEAMHSYDCPCAIVLPIAGGSRAFLDWISQETSAAAG